MAHIAASILAVCSMVFTDSLPINNGFSVKFNPLAINEEVRIKSFGALFAKIPQDPTTKPGSIGVQYLPEPPELLGGGCTNQVAKIDLSNKIFNEGQGLKDEDEDDKQEIDSKSILNLPLLKQPYESYKILVATAPAHLSLYNEDDDNPLIVYIIFEDNGQKKSGNKNIPSIYFVKKHLGKMDTITKEKAEPIFIIDSNRTITGLKSNDIEKYVKFKNKFNRRYTPRTKFSDKSKIGR